MSSSGFLRHLVRAGPIVLILSASAVTLYTLIDSRIALKKRSSVIDSIGFDIDQSRNIAKTRSKDEDPVVTEQLKDVRKAYKKLEKSAAQKGPDYELKPVPKPDGWYK